MPQSPRVPLSLSLPRLYAIVDGELCARSNRTPLDVSRAFLSAGAKLLQLRCKSWSSGDVLDLASQVVADATAAGAMVIINDRADVAAMSRAHGLHVGQDDLLPRDARAVIGDAALLGLSTHTSEQWEAAVKEPVSYIAIGPVFGSGTKQTGYQAIGLETVQRASKAAARAGLPTVAIGGITIDNAAAVVAAGATSVAIISDLLVGDAEARCRAVLGILA